MGHFTINPTENGQRVDAVCGKKFAEFSRSQWQKYGIFTLKNQPKPGKTKVKTGEEWQYEMPEKKSPLVEKKIDASIDKLKILAEDDDWVAIEKPAGIVVHSSPSDPYSTTIIDLLRDAFDTLAEGAETVDGQMYDRSGLVHRLDKPTSGVLLIAKNNKTHRFLQSHWGEVKKVYIAIVKGKPPLFGEIESGMGRDMYDRKKIAVRGGKEEKWSITHFARKKYDRGKSWLEVKIETGRTHQIRVHLSAIGFPVWGDEMYSGQKSDRLYLHAHRLIFPDPKNPQKNITITSPIPKKFRNPR